MTTFDAAQAAAPPSPERRPPSTGRDVRTVGWLRWRQFRDDAVYWLRVLGYQPNDKTLSQQFYVIYLAIFGLIWAAAMFAYFGEMAGRLAEAATPAALPDVFRVLAWGVLIAQVYVVVTAMRTTPLKLTFADIAYLAASPVNRAAPALLNLLRLLGVRMAVLIVPLLLFAIFVTRTLRDPLTVADGGRIVLFAGSLIAITWGLAWAVGLPRLIDPHIRRLRGLWLLPVLAIPLAIVIPDVLLLPGRALELAILDQLPLIGYIVALVLAVGVVAAAVRLGAFVNMTQAADESVMFARIQALGTLAWTQPQVQARIRLQSMGGGRRAFLRLPTGRGFNALIGRAALSYIRHPGALIAAAVWGFAVTLAAMLIVSGSLPFQVWIGWILFVGLIPPGGLLRVFRSDVEEPFLRQFLIVDGLQLLLADALLPFTALLVGSGIALAFSPLPETALVYAVTAVPLAAALITLLGAWSLTQRRVLQSRLFGSLFAFGAAAGAGMALGSPLVAAAVLLVGCMVVAGLVLQDG